MADQQRNEEAGKGAPRAKAEAPAAAKMPEELIRDRIAQGAPASAGFSTYTDGSLRLVLPHFGLHPRIEIRVIDGNTSVTVE